MRPSPFRHPIAVLRTLLALNQEEFGKEIGLSRRTIQSIELGKLRLTEANALKIEEKTGASIHWLLAGDPSVPPYREDPVTGEKIPYTKRDFELIKAGENAEFKVVEPERTAAWFHRTAIAGIHHWFVILLAADKRGEFNLAQYYADKFFKEMEERFGCDWARAKKVSGLACLQEPDNTEWAFMYDKLEGTRTETARLRLIKGKTGIKLRLRAGSPNKR